MVGWLMLTCVCVCSEPHPTTHTFARIPALPLFTLPPSLYTTKPHNPTKQKAKARMSACRATLQEAARWHRLVREANAGFANGEMAQVKEKADVMK